MYGNNGIISNTQDVATLANIKTLEEGIELYKVNKNIEEKIEEESYPLALNEEGSRITLEQMRNSDELSNGEVYGIGKNDYGQLGTGDSVGRTEFVRCSNLEE